jgi:hypothetical protein
MIMYIYAQTVVKMRYDPKKEGALDKHVVFVRRIVKHGTVSGKFS